MHLRHSLSKVISKCQGNCGKKILGTDNMIVKSYGTTKFTNKDGKEICRHGPLCIHFNSSCLKAFDKEQYYAPGEDFDFTLINIGKETLNDLNGEEKKFLMNIGVIF